jgi:uncharacterized protein with beta-barrel porin domain
MEGYSESGAGVLSMSYDNASFKQLVSLLGGRIHADIPLLEDSVNLQPSVSAAWAHNFGDNTADVDANFNVSSATTFTGEGAELDRDSLRLGADLSLDYDQPGPMVIYTADDGDIAADASSHAFRGGLRIKW